MPNDPTSAVPEEVFKTVEKEYMPEILEGVRARARELASEHKRTVPSYVDVFRAFEQRFVGGIGPQSQSIWRENLFLIIVVLMTITFGLMGLLPYLFGDPTKVGYKPEFFLDIAKLFAGVVVGGAAGVANAAVASRRVRG